MAGVKGRSGGARAGAGRKPSALVEGREAQAHGGALKRQKAVPVPQDECDMLTMLQNVALGKTGATSLQVRAAIAAVRYTHAKKGESTGKKEQGEAAAKAAASGKYGVRQGPRLAVINK